MAEQSTSVFFVLAAVAVGMLLAFQPGANAELGDRLGHPLLAAVFNFTLGLSVLAVVALVFRVPKPNVAAAAGGPWWAWFGGLVGATIVTTSLILTRRMGVATMFTAIIAGQLLASLAVDHFGLVSQPVRKVSLLRVLGVVLVIVGTLVFQADKWRSDRNEPPEAASDPADGATRTGAG